MLLRIAFAAGAESALALAEAIEPLCFSIGWFGSERDAVWRVEGLAAEPLDRAGLDAAIAARAGALRIRPPEIHITPLPDRDWVRDNLASFRPVQVGRYRIRGTHVAEHPRAGVVLTLDAGLAFGTGEHPSTRGCLLALDRLARGRIPARFQICAPTGARGPAGRRANQKIPARVSIHSAPIGARARRRIARVLDLGCGSGVLAMAAAATWKAARVTASDIDPDAVATAAANARRNRLAPRIAAIAADGLAARAFIRRGGFDLVLANILARPLIRLARPLGRALAPGGIAILAGFIAADAAWVAAPYRARGLRLVERADREGWTTLILKRTRGLRSLR
jgi:ribosomal protein L11 methyltransferase